ncbi:MAG: hypothetical protein N3G75_07695 [Methanothrix sp.]|nr:hypothetical protein [Methanothrix sp.]MCX8207697.1 hypothetical protein [Methanothrix sp.]
MVARYAFDETAYIVVEFGTGQSVSVSIYDLADNSLIVEDADMTEIGSTGLYKYAFDPGLETPAFKHYLYIASDGASVKHGVLIFGGYPDELDAISATLSETSSRLSNLESVVSGLSSRISDLETEVVAMDADVGELVDFTAGNRVVENNQLIMYTPNGQTEIARFNLFDQAGRPTMTNVYRRERVL